MKRAFVLLVGPAMASCLFVAIATGHHMRHGQILSVAEARARLERDAHGWAGRIVLVRGVVQVGFSKSPVGACDQPACSTTEPLWRLAEPDDQNPDDSLLLAWSAPDPLWTDLRHVPGVGLLLPRQQVLQVNMVATYRIQLMVLASAAGAGGYGAALVDAAP